MRNDNTQQQKKRLGNEMSRQRDFSILSVSHRRELTFEGFMLNLVTFMEGLSEHKIIYKINQQRVCFQSAPRMCCWDDF